MSETHIPEDVFARWLDGEMEDRPFLRRLLVHLLASCVTCDLSWQQVGRTRLAGKGLLAEIQHELALRGAGPREAVFGALEQVRALKSEVLEKDSPALAQQRLRQLLEHPRGDRLGIVSRCRTRYVSPRLAFALLEAARALAPRDAEQSGHLAALAGAVARKAAKTPHQRAVAEDFYALSLALQGNAHRLAGDYRRAARCLRGAEAHLERGSGDPVTFADVQSYRGSLLKDQWRLGEARIVIERAIRVYRNVGHDHQAGRALMKLALVEECGEDPGKAVEALAAAREHLDFRLEPHLEQQLFRNLAKYVALAGDPQRGLEILREHPGNRSEKRRDRLRRDWIEAQILGMLGRYPEAVLGLELAREGLLAIGDIPNTAMATLDLALLFAERGEAAEVKRLAAEALPAILASGLPQQIVASLMLFEQAAGAERASLDLLKQVRSTLRDRQRWLLKGGVN